MNRTHALLLTPLMAFACHAEQEPTPIQIDTTAANLSYSFSLASSSLYGGTSYNSTSYSADFGSYSYTSSFGSGGGTKSGVSTNGPSTDGIVSSELSGAQLERSLLDNLGAPISATLADGRAYQMVVVGAFVDEASGRTYFDVQTSLDGGDWIPLCGVDDDAPILALAIPGVFTAQPVVPGDRAGGWRPSSNEFNFACRGSSVAKCVEMGFAPHLDRAQSTGDRTTGVERDVDTPQSQIYHQACVRMLRADYCGDGRSFTESGVTLNHWDTRARWPSLSGWNFEAGWDDNGAICIEDTRLDHASLPACVTDRIARKCGGRDNRQAYLGSAF